MKTTCILLLAMLFFNNLTGQTFNLPAPQKTGGMPFMETLAKRATAWTFNSTEISIQQLSNLLWASFGVNRADGRRTAPSASNKQEIDIYVLLKKGIYVYDAMKNKLNLISSEDIRNQVADKGFAEAPVQLVFIADLAKSGGDTEENLRTANINCGYISQNTYLYCTSEGLVTGARSGFNRDVLIQKLKLRPEQKILLAHAVGYPKKK